MIKFTVAFLLGDLFLQTFSQLPSFTTCAFLLLVTCILSVVLQNYCQYAYLLLAVCLGFTWSAWTADQTLHWTLKKEWEGKPLIATGTIYSIPLKESSGVKFTFALTSLQYEKIKIYPYALIRLTWLKPISEIKVGDVFQCQVNLKRIHSTQNPGGFDYEAWALQKGLRATGRVLDSKENKRLSHLRFTAYIDQVRQTLLTKIKFILPHSPTSAWLLALTLGEREEIAALDWQVLRNTGTNHLMAIAGLHIGMIAGLTHLLFTQVWRLFPRLCLYFPAKLAGASVAWLVAITYSLMAGFSIPTQRACLMLTIFTFALLSRRRINPWQCWSLALLIVLILNPLSVLTESIWLSFGTIAIILYGMSGRLAPKGWWWKWGRVQWVVGIGLTPLTLMLFQQTSLISFIANTIAIPWLGFFILPFCFLSVSLVSFSPLFAAKLLWLADKSLSLLWVVLTFLSHTSMATWHIAIPNYFLLLTTLIAFFILLLPSGFFGRTLGFFWLIPLITYTPPLPALNEMWLTVVDVGQGLAIVIRTNRHVLVYDTGPRLSASTDAGENILLPYLRLLHIKKINKLVISHGDNDHIGGTKALIEALPIDSIQSSVPEKINSEISQLCLAGEKWHWDGIDFQFLYPGKRDLQLGNDSSCVLSISNQYHRILLTGDIEKQAENTLLITPALLKSQVLIAPHHGSKTSSSIELIEAVQPEIVIYATGYRNRYHFPHQSVTDNYAHHHVKQLNTAIVGMINLQFKNQANVMVIDSYRHQHKRYWYD